MTRPVRAAMDEILDTILDPDSSDDRLDEVLAGLDDRAVVGLNLIGQLLTFRTSELLAAQSS